MSSTTSNNSTKLVYGSLLIAGACAFLCIAIVAQAQYNTFDSDSNSDSDGNPILTQSELGKLVRSSAKAQGRHNSNQNQQLAAATRNLYNKQQPMQYAQSHNRRNYGSPSSDGGSLSGYGPVMGAASHGRGSNSEPNDDDENESSNAFGPNFDSSNNDDDGESRNSNGADGAMNLNQAASGYPGQVNSDYNSDSVGASFGGFDGQGYGPSSGDGSDIGPSEGFGGSGRRAKSASSLLGYRGGQDGDDVGALQYGPSSAINSGDGDEGGANYAPEGQNDNDNDDE